MNLHVSRLRTLRMAPAVRLEMSLELTEMSHKLVSDGVRARHAEYTDEQVRMATIRIWLGHADFGRAYPDAEKLDP